MSWAVRAGETVYMSGHVAMEADGTVVGEGDAEAQAEHIFQGLEATLAGAGATFADVVKLTCYCVSPDVYAGYAAVKKKYVGPQAPAGTALVVKALLDPKLLLEVEAVAVIPAVPSKQPI
jgi:enamine deaminase RidA (YjgF/YER057c/UK114 family)